MLSIVRGKIRTDWTKFNIQITKSGEKLLSKYSLVVDADSVLDTADLDIIQATPVNLENMIEGEDPFATVSFAETVFKGDTELPVVSDADINSVDVTMPF